MALVKVSSLSIGAPVVDNEAPLLNGRKVVWEVMNKSHFGTNYTLLMSFDIVAVMAYGNLNWFESNIRNYLKTTFVPYVGPNLIKAAQEISIGSGYDDAAGGPANTLVNDKIFILSAQQLGYSPASLIYATNPGSYGSNSGAIIGQPAGLYISEFGGQWTDWWTRTPTNPLDLADNLYGVEAEDPLSVFARHKTGTAGIRPVVVLGPDAVVEQSGAYWNIISTLPSYTKVDGSLKQVVQGYTKVDGSLKQIVQGYTKVDGVLKQIL